MAGGKSLPHPLDTHEDNLVCKALECLLSLLLTRIGTAKIWTAFSCDYGVQSGVHSLAIAEDDLLCILFKPCVLES